MIGIQLLICAIITLMFKINIYLGIFVATWMIMRMFLALFRKNVTVTSIAKKVKEEE